MSLNKEYSISRREKWKSQSKLDQITISKADSKAYLNPYNCSSVSHLNTEYNHINTKLVQTNEVYKFLFDKMTKKMKRHPSSKRYEISSHYVSSIRKSTSKEISETTGTLQIGPTDQPAQKKCIIRPKSSYTRIKSKNTLAWK